MSSGSNESRPHNPELRATLPGDAPRRVPRRLLLGGLPVAWLLSGCVGGSAVEKDPYIQAMTQDPMMVWESPFPGKKWVTYDSRDDKFKGGSWSYVDIWLTPADPHVVPALMAAARMAATAAGYSERSRRYGGMVHGDDFWIMCEVSPTILYAPGATPQSQILDTVHIKLSAPFQEP